MRLAWFGPRVRGWAESWAEDWRRVDRWGVLLAGAVLGTCYALAYLHDPVRPGRNPAMPLGWSGWFDQSVTLRSTVALLAGNLDPSQHHYPLGYSLLAMPFQVLTPGHAFFAIDLLSLLAALGGCVALGRRLGLSGVVAAGLFGFGVLGAPAVFRQWVLPWNTTPVAACLWLLLAVVAGWLDGVRRPWAAGVLMGAVVACRPSDAVSLLPCVGAILWAERQLQPGWAAVAARLVGGGAAVVLPVVALHLAIYGWAQSPYMIDSARLGFTADGFGWKASVLLVNPFAWFAEGEGLLQRTHWLALGLLGVAPALLRGAKERVLALCLLVHGAMYVAYVDLLPTGLWRFFNVHYFAWAYPGVALLGGLLLRDLALGPRRWWAVAGAGLTVPLLCLQVVPVAATGERAKAVDFAGPIPPYLETMFTQPLVLRDAGGTLWKGLDFRAFPYPGGVRVIGLRRELAGAVTWAPGYAPHGFEGAVAGARWETAVRFAWPPAWWAPPRAPVLGLPTE